MRSAVELGLGWGGTRVRLAGLSGWGWKKGTMGLGEVVRSVLFAPLRDEEVALRDEVLYQC